MNTIISKEKPEQAIVILQGGAALGAYECGAFKILAPEIDKLQKGLAVIGGTSVGALNAAIIARSYQNQRTRTGTATATVAAKDLETFWTTVLPNPSPPLFPPYPGLQFPFAEMMQRTLNLWITMLLGNPHMFAPDPYALSPFAPAHYSTKAMEKTLKEYFGTYEGCQPRLIVEAVNIQSGHAETFDSGVKRVTPEMIVACGSIPAVVPAKEVEGEYYWDGGLYSNTPLGAVMNALQSSSCNGQTSAEEPIPTYQVYLVNDHPHQAPLPQDLIGVLERAIDILLTDKSENDIKAAEKLNQYIRLVQFIKQYFDKLPLEVQQKINQAYQEITQREKWAILNIVQLKRGGLPYDYWSSTGDFSLNRIKELIAQGKRETQQQLEDLGYYDSLEQGGPLSMVAMEKKEQAGLMHQH